ncbi:MAG: ABC transporter ATP-binding protein [Thermodesulfobacteriota bacterium]
MTDTTNATLLQATGVTKNFEHEGGTIEVLKGIDLEVAQGEMVAIVGASGSGKTTLLQILGTLDLPTGGSLLFKGREMTKENDDSLAGYRNHSIGFIFQFHHLLPEFTALENVMMPGLIGGKKQSELEEPGKELLDHMDLGHRLTHKVTELSGGEQQRVALARALLMKPSLLLADEPTGNLDSRSGRLVFDLLNRLCNDMGLATVMVTHNMELASKMDRCLHLKDGMLTNSEL